jgi:hypothetical protein
MSPEAEALERMIDASSVEHVLSLLSIICLEKADHIRSNWQDPSLARVWAGMSSKLDRTADIAQKRGI